MSTPSPNTPTILNPRPKARFQQSNNNIASHRDMVDRPEFQRAADFSILEYLSRLCEQEKDYGIRGVKISGALEFLQQMRLLSEKLEVKPMPKPTDNLTQQ